MSLKSKRRETGMTQKEAAKHFGIKYRTYQNYENGVTSPDMDTAAMFARYFHCTIGDLFDLEEGANKTLDSDELELIHIYRDLTQHGKDSLMQIAKDLRHAIAIINEGQPHSESKE